MQTSGIYLKKCFLILSLCILTLIGIGSASAQTATGIISGTLTDPKGLPMAGANVVVHNVDTGADQTVTTNEVGRYVFPQVTTKPAAGVAART